MDMGELQPSTPFSASANSGCIILGGFPRSAFSYLVSFSFQQLASPGHIHAVFVLMLVCSGYASFLPVHRSFSCSSLDMHIVTAWRYYLRDMRLTDLNYLMGLGVY